VLTLLQLCQVFKTLGQPLLERLLQGFNISVMAYGQTGTGKTHSMAGPPGSGGLTGNNRGLIPRMMEDLMRKKENLELQGTYLLCAIQVRSRVISTTLTCQSQHIH
jgi:hypothetical protein